MSNWSAKRGRHVLSVLLHLGWEIKRQKGSHIVLEKSGSPNYVWSFRDSEEIGSRMLARIAKKTGLKPEDL